MRKQIKIIIGVIIIGLIGFAIYKYSKRNEIKLKNSTITHVEYDDEMSQEPLEDEIDYDSLFHKEICSDYGNFWKTFDKKKDKIKEVEFNYKSGKLLISYYENNNSKNKDLNDGYNFDWNFYEKRKDNKIIGRNDQVERDTIMYWIYNKDKSELIDEKGLVYKKLINR